MKTRHSLATILLVVAIGVTFELSSTLLQAQPYRNWVDTTRPEPVVPYMLGAKPTFPLSAYVYDFSQDYPDTILFDNILHRVYGNLLQDSTGSRFDTMLTTLLTTTPSGLRAIWIPRNVESRPSYITEASNAREVLFFPFDSAQLRAVPQFSSITQHREWLFTEYTYSFLQRNPLVVIDGDLSQEAVYNTSLAKTVVASGIAFQHEKDRHVYRWDSLLRDGVWWPSLHSGVLDQWDSLIRSDVLFSEIDYSKNPYTEHRSPHYIVVKGHLFSGGSASMADTLLRIRIYYDVDKGKTYLDSSSSYVVADTNLRFLYDEVGITKLDLYPNSGVSPFWGAYCTVTRKIDFRFNGGMGGPTDPGVTAQKIDMEVEYLGGEKLALHAVGIRDSIANLLLGTGAKSMTYYTLMYHEIVNRIDIGADSTLQTPAILLDISDVPKFETFLGLRRVNEFLGRTFRLAEPDSSASAQETLGQPRLLPSFKRN